MNKEEVINQLNKEGFCLNQSKINLVNRTIELIEQEEIEFLKEIFNEDSDCSDWDYRDYKIQERVKQLQEDKGKWMKNIKKIY